jgi:hypothetical protein
VWGPLQELQQLLLLLPSGHNHLCFLILIKVIR